MMAEKENSQVLVVDDNQDAVAVIEAAFTGLPVHVHTASTIGEARSLIQDKSFHLAILDVYLPDGTSAELVDAIRAAGSNTAIIIVTGVTDGEDASEIADVEADAYLPKPVDVPRLIALAEDLLG